MLLIKTKIKQSQIEGIGLFADEFIPKGTIVWQLDINLDRLISKDDFEKMPAIQKEYIKKYAYSVQSYPFIILCADNARFVNHAVLGNLCAGSSVFGYMEQSVAIKDIEIGEELLEDYNIFDDTDKDGKYY